jgi:aryl-alcohol dehydrogenase-like predicted oxidoreductase
MKRRNFLAASALAGIFAQPGSNELMNAMLARSSQKPLPRRRYNDDVDLSIVGFGAIILMGMDQRESDRVVAQAIDLGVNYFDVAPSYGDGEAEERLGPALKPHRGGVFLACKTMERDAEGAAAELRSSLKNLKTDRFDLYQFHAVTELEEVERIFGAGGAAEAVLKARDEGTIRYIGFSAHSEAAALAMMERFRFDSVLFPFNHVCYARGNFGPAVMERARERGVARLALKMLARGPWPEGADRSGSRAWYQPIESVEEARRAVRFTLSEDITAAIPPGDARLFRLAVTLATEFEPLSAEERADILAGTAGLKPLFPLG